MSMMCEELRRKFEEHPLYSQDEKVMDAEVIAKITNPFGAGTWLITEAEKQEDGDWLLFGYCHIFEWEWGYVMFSELDGIRIELGEKVLLPLHLDIGDGKTVREELKHV